MHLGPSWGNLGAILGSLGAILAVLEAFGEHKGDGDRSEDFDLISLTVPERASLISTWVALHNERP